MKSLDTWTLIRVAVERKMPVMLLYVVHSEGSSPGRRGFSMAVNALGETAGTIGGGVMEFKFVELAKDRLQHHVGRISLHRQVHNKTAITDRSGMICSGEQTIALLPLFAKDQATIDGIIRSISQGESLSITISPQGLSTSTIMPPAMDGLAVFGPDQWTYTETLGMGNRLSIIGAGHCALALSRLMRTLDFRLELYEERRALKTFEENEAVHEKHLVDDYRSLGTLLLEGEQEYVVVMTVGYRTDAVVLQAILHKSFRYLGVLGSEAKMDTMRAELSRHGIPREMIARMHAPIGLPIHSQSAEEVAVSIAAEIIKVKNGR